MMTSLNNPAIVLEAQGLQRDYVLSKGLMSSPLVLHAVKHVSFAIEAGKTLAVVGESGCGKSTLARLVTMIEAPTAGSLKIHDIDVATATPKQLSALRTQVQLVFQDPYGSLNPRKRIGDILEEPLKINTTMERNARKEAVSLMLERIGLRAEYASRYPHMFSGGQRQRIAIARALMLRPKIVVADEPVSALDISVRAQILNLLMDIQEEMGVAYLFISHDLGVVERIAHRVMVMYLGSVVEYGKAEDIFAKPLHPYTQALIAAAPSTERNPNVKLVSLKGEFPSPLEQITGCALAKRCPLVSEKCRTERPLLRHIAGHEVACHHPS